MPLIPIIWAVSILGGGALGVKFVSETEKLADTATKLALIGGGLYVASLVFKRK